MRREIRTVVLRGADLARVVFAQFAHGAADAEADHAPHPSSAPPEDKP